MNSFDESAEWAMAFATGINYILPGNFVGGFPQPVPNNPKSLSA